MALRTYIVEDNATIRENLIGTLEELTSITALGWAEAEADAKAWLAAHDGEWDLAIVDLFLKQGSGLGVLQACSPRGPQQRVVTVEVNAEGQRTVLVLGVTAQQIRCLHVVPGGAPVPPGQAAHSFAAQMAQIQDEAR